MFHKKKGLGMEHNELDEKKQRILQKLSRLPRYMLQLHGRENIAEFILHELGKQECFNLNRAAYVVDNPDFDCLQGIAGYARDEEYGIIDKDIWDDPDSFSTHMKSCSYNGKVREFKKGSHIKQGLSEKEIVDQVAKDLGFDNPSYYSWPVKNDNHGILLYQKHDLDACDCDYLLDGLCLMGFCPIY